VADIKQKAEVGINLVNIQSTRKRLNKPTVATMQFVSHKLQVAKASCLKK
jgi:hypothetical protein